MKIYTKTGDQGETCLFDGSRTSKDDVRLELIGDIDELSSYLGLIHSYIVDKKDSILFIINDLYRLSAHLAGAKNFAIIDLSTQVLKLEQSIDEMDSWLNELTTFIYPIGSVSIATINIARTICGVTIKTRLLGSEISIIQV